MASETRSVTIFDGAIGTLQDFAASLRRVNATAKGGALSSVTAAVGTLRQAGVAFTEHEYAHEERGGTRVSPLDRRRLLSPTLVDVATSPGD